MHIMGLQFKGITGFMNSNVKLFLEPILLNAMHCISSNKMRALCQIRPKMCQKSCQKMQINGMEIKKEQLQER